MVLDICNRTENWKTAYEFAPLFRDANARRKLAKCLGEPEETKPSQVTLELYWKGLRDYLHQNKRGADKTLNADAIRCLANRYSECFSDLREKIEKYTVKDRGKRGTFKILNERNYRATEAIRLGNNLYNTEIDIVLETPHSLYIGEAKLESDFGTNGDLVLVHQLIRQYVMARILLNYLGKEKVVVPFVVGPDASKLKNYSQVDFMICQGWLKEKNVLEWKDISNLYS
jgi:hypothetical protein